MINTQLTPPANGSRVIVNGNLQPYAMARVVNSIFNKDEDRWGIILEWPNLPDGPAFSRVYSTDEGKGWYRYSAAN